LELQITVFSVSHYYLAAEKPPLVKREFATAKVPTEIYSESVYKSLSYSVNYFISFLQRKRGDLTQRTSSAKHFTITLPSRENVEQTCKHFVSIFNLN
jgi:hypothetical protein